MTDPSDLDGVLEQLLAGNIGGARDRIDTLVAAMPADVAPGVRARATRVAATAHRLSGDVAGARRIVDDALIAAAAPGIEDATLAIEAEMELAALLHMLGRHAEATAADRRALDLMARVDMPEPLRAKVTLLTTARRLATDPAGALQQIEDLASLLPTIDPSDLTAVPEPVRALLEALDAVLTRPPSEAVPALERAATVARRDEDVGAYVGARLAIAQLEEQRGDRVAAYRSLAKGFVTLSANYDIDLARDAFSDAMHDCMDRWGTGAFAEVKRTVESGG